MPTACMYVLSLQLCPALCDPRDCSPPGFFVHGILQAGILKWVAMPSSRGSSWPRVQTRVSSSLPSLCPNPLCCSPSHVCRNGTEKSFSPWDKLLLIMVYDPSLYYIVGFTLLVFWWGFLHLCLSVISACNSLYLCVIPVSGLGIRVMMASWMSLEVFLCKFWNSFIRIGINSLNVW